MTVEHATQAIILSKAPFGEADAQVFLYTRKLGKLLARVIGARKILSKLNSHLEPLNVVYIRLVGKNKWHIADALKIGALPTGVLEGLNLVREIAPEEDPDPELWTLLSSGIFGKSDILRVLGFGKELAACQLCGLRNDLKFSTAHLAYFCVNCMFPARKSVREAPPANF